MDRLETCAFDVPTIGIPTFTFQYGQIRNTAIYGNLVQITQIYIPVWIDQKPKSPLLIEISFPNLHSSMDRLETQAY